VVFSNINNWIINRDNYKNNDKEVIYMNNYFKPAGDLEENKNLSLEQNESFIKNYLLEIVNNNYINDDLENLIGSGSMIISFKKLREMIEEGCFKFIKAEYLNPEMIIVEFNKYEINNKTK